MGGLSLTSALQSHVFCLPNTKNLLGLHSCQSLSALKLKAINRAGRSCSYCVIQLSSVHLPAPTLPEQHFQLLRAQQGLCLMIHKESLLKNHLPVKVRLKRHTLHFFYTTLECTHAGNSMQSIWYLIFFYVILM